MDEGEVSGSEAMDRLGAAYERWGDALFRYAVVVCADVAMAEDAVQQAFLKMAGRVGEVGLLEAYLRTAVRHECYRLLKGRKEAVVGEEVPGLLEAVEAGVEREEERRGLERALARLPVEQREVVHLKVWEGRTFKEIGEVMGVSMNTVASQYRYAMEKLRALMGIGEEVERER